MVQRRKPVMFDRKEKVQFVKQLEERRDHLADMLLEFSVRHFSGRPYPEGLPFEGDDPFVPHSDDLVQNSRAMVHLIYEIDMLTRILLRVRGFYHEVI